MEPRSPAGPDAAAPEPAVCRQARALLHRVIVGHDDVAVLITEVEAYNGPDDPASHAFTRTPRSATMYGPPHRLYVYRIHGHHCANIVTSPEGEGSAVLLRAGVVVDGLAVARQRRGEVPEAQLARGPGNLARALGLTMADLHADLADPAGVHLAARVPGNDETAALPAERIGRGPRVGVRLAADRPWRYWVLGEPSVSAYRRHRSAQPG